MSPGGVQITTVAGPIDAADAGVTLVHEHLFVDLSVWFETPEEPEVAALVDAPVTMSLLGRLRRQPFATTRQNLRLDDPALAAAEAQRFAQAGGRTIVDVTPPALGRDPEALRRLAAETGLNVVMG